jgi:hypothetical protein
MKSFDDELRQLEYGRETREGLTRLVQLAREALDASDPGAAAHAKALEVRYARTLGEHQHAVVAAAELLEMLPAARPFLVEQGDEAAQTRAYQLKKHLIWGLKYACGSAMDLPEIPLKTADELISVLEQLLRDCDHPPYAAWQLRARRQFIAGEHTLLREEVERLLPLVNRHNHFFEHMDCPGCSLLQFAQFLGPTARPEEVFAVLDPVLQNRPFPSEPETSKQVLDVFLGKEVACDNAKSGAPAHYARALARAGRAEEAKPLLARAARFVKRDSPDRAAVVVMANLEVASAGGDVAEIRKVVPALQALAATLEDAYEKYEALRAVQGGLRVLARHGGDDSTGAQMAMVTDEILALAQRMDARLERPRHVADVMGA